MNPTTPTRSYYPALDGLRGIAILLVIACHNFNFLPNFQFGWIGVDLFFVLSGFLITDILLSTKGSQNFLQNFYIRRILRIFPLYYGVVLVFFIFAPAFQNLQLQYNYYHSYQPLSWFHLQNWLYIFKPKPNDFLLMNHFWSLSLEEQFYLVWPLIIFAVKSNRRLSEILCVIIAASILLRFSSWLHFGDGYTNFYLQYMTRVDGLCVGSLVAVWRFSDVKQAGKKVLRLASILLGIHVIVFILSRTVLPDFPHFNFLGYSSIAAIFGVIVSLCIKNRNRVSKFFLENSVLRYFGRISYGLYVYHWPILVLGKIYFLDRLIHNGHSYEYSIMTVSVAALALTLLVATASYYLLEKKMLILKDIMTEQGLFEKLRKKLLVFLYNTSSTE
jgi:peptidoglycan/LPS O-acetylase OafA/YrhL